jgi:hypothetical protein
MMRIVEGLHDQATYGEQERCHQSNQAHSTRVTKDRLIVLFERGIDSVSARSKHHGDSSFGWNEESNVKCHMAGQTRFRKRGSRGLEFLCEEFSSTASFTKSDTFPHQANHSYPSDRGQGWGKENEPDRGARVLVAREQIFRPVR